MELSIPDQLPQLALGDNDKGSGKACIMNAISYLNGDKKISDMPSCVFKPLARLAQVLNDEICTETVHVSQGNDLLCPQHSHMMWLFGGRLIGTAEAARNLVGTNHWNQYRLTVRLGVWAVNYLQPHHPHIIEQVQAVQSWLDRKITTRQVCNLNIDGPCYKDDHDREDDDACSAARTLVSAITADNDLREPLAVNVLIDVASGLPTEVKKMTFAYALLAEFDRITGQQHLHQWTADEFALVRDEAGVDLVTVTA